MSSNHYLFKDIMMNIILKNKSKKNWLIKCKIITKQTIWNTHRWWTLIWIGILNSKSIILTHLMFYYLKLLWGKKILLVGTQEFIQHIKIKILFLILEISWNPDYDLSIFFIFCLFLDYFFLYFFVYKYFYLIILYMFKFIVFSFLLVTFFTSVYSLI